MDTSPNSAWWQTGIIYEIYLRSFQDTNDDGIGDLKGITSRLDYLQWLGVNTIWVTPFYPSPMKDFGYDVSNYTAVDPLFGTMGDFEHLLTELHKRGMKLVIDFVPNHTSDQHPWFTESRSSKDNPKRDWYIWKDPNSKGDPPNNWLSVLGGSAWEWDEKTGQYYYHAFLKEQPDLNLQNKDVLHEIKNVMRFWLDKGIDGFRVDVMWHLAKDKLFRDNPPNPDYKKGMPDCDQLLQIYNCDQPEVHATIAELRKVVDEYSDRILMGEIYLPVGKCMSYYGPKNSGAHLPSNFELLFIPWESKKIANAITEYEACLPEGAWPNWVIGNHDRPRLISRLDKEQMKVAAILLLTLRGTPIMYYGDEIGIPQVPIPDDEVRDPQGLLMPGKNLSRDPQRTPMQWSARKNAGFSGGKPWLRLSEDYKTENVEAEQKKDDSLLWFYKRLIALRENEPSLMNGNYRLIYSDEKVLCYCREAPHHDTFLVALNFSAEISEFNLRSYSFNGKMQIHTCMELEGTEADQSFSLAPNAGCIIRLNKE